ncbi:MAG: hypothetical protein JWQ70_538 [Aeromicrobium sp.]|nr:hypothetical protein [Aeromicrobium sp.]
MTRFKCVVPAAMIAGLLVTVGFGAPAQAAPLHPTSAAMPMGCGDISMAAYGPIGGNWSRTYYGRCGHVDTKHKPTITVSWEVPFFSSSWACVKARGYKWADGKSYWVSLGCGTGGHGTVHWGQTGHQVMSTTAVKAKSENIVIGAPVYFTD